MIDGSQSVEVYRICSHFFNGVAFYV